MQYSDFYFYLLRVCERLALINTGHVVKIREKYVYALRLQTTAIGFVNIKMEKRLDADIN